MTQVKCNNCEWTGETEDCNGIRDFWSRVDVGGEVPAGDCPKCGAFAYLVKTATVPPISAARDWRLVLQDLVWAAEYDLRPLGQCGPSKSQAVANGNKLLADTASVPPEAAEYAKRAVEMWCNDELSIDGEPAVSIADSGAWVQAWVWVDAPDEQDPEPPYPCDTIKA